MIIVRLIGGHSNQLFQYATGRRLALKLNTELKLDLTWFDTDFGEETTPRQYELDSYSLPIKIVDKKDLAKINNASGQERRSWGSIKSKLNKSPLITRLDEKHLGFNKEVLAAPDNTYLVGYWQNEKYFKDIRKTLLKELEPITPINPRNHDYLNQIRSCEAVSLHIRRGDYANNAATKEFHGLMSLEYYHKAYEKIRQANKKKDLRIFVFSTDIDWCKKNLEFDTPIIFVEGNKKGADDMRLMKNCKHNIMANSSFSWWGAWLNQNPDKMVVAPRNWFENKKAAKEMDIIPAEWIKL